MESPRKSIVVGLLLVVVVGAVTVEMVGGSLIYVGGGKETWRPNVNFTEWSNHQHVYVDDWLYFGFKKNLYSVLQVNKTSYESCNDMGFIMNITKGGRDVFQVTEAKTYFFLSSGGYCWGGMKVAINVVEDVPPPSSPHPTSSGHHKNSSSPSNFGDHAITVMVLVSILLLCWAIH